MGLQTVPSEEFDVIWASPRVQNSVRQKTTGTRDLKYMMKLVTRALKIIKYFEPKWYVIETRWDCYGTPQ